MSSWFASNDTSSGKELYDAAQHADEDVVRKLLKNATAKDVNWIGKDGSTALAYAASNRYTQIVEMLLSHPGIDVNLLGNEIERLALIEASWKGHTEIVRMLLGHPGINVNLQNKNGYSALISASRNGRPEIVKILLDHPGIDVNLQDEDGNSALISATYYGHTEIVRMLLGQPGIDVNMQNKDGNLALITASRRGHSEIVKILLGHPGIDVNLQDEMEASVLISASCYGHTEIVRMLLGHPGINVNLQKEYGWTAFACALKRGHAQIVEILLSHPEIDVNRQNKIKCSALITASEIGHTKLVKFLLGHPGIKVNLQNKDGSTSLVEAASRGHTQIVEMLLSHPGIDVNLQNEIERSALIEASWKGHAEVVKMLLGHPGIDVNLQCENSALMCASERGHTEIVKMLLAQPGIKLDLQDEDGVSALSKASDNGHSEIVEMLSTYVAIDSTNTDDQYGDVATAHADSTDHIAIAQFSLEHSHRETVFAPRLEDKNASHDSLAETDNAATLAEVEEQGQVEQNVALAVMGIGKNETTESHSAENMNNNPDAQTDEPVQHSPFPSTTSEATTNSLASPTSGLHSPDTFQESWLAVWLLKQGVHPQLVRDCEMRLVEKESIITEVDFAELSPSQVDAAFLNRIGIEAIGVQVRILRLHKELREQYSLTLSQPQPLPPPPSTSPLSLISSESTTVHNATSTFFCGSMPIEAFPLVTDALSRHGTVSSRKMLQGYFNHTTIDVHGHDKVTKYNCVLKCAGNEDNYTTHSEGSRAIEREYIIYKKAKEIAILKKLPSTGCIDCFHAHPSGNYLVLEHYGRNIQHLLVPNFRFAHQLTEAIIAAVAALHALNVMHGDIKPYNLLYTFDHDHGYTVKLCDLDCAYEVDNICPATALGTQQYESPEVYLASRAGQSVSTALSMDLFSMGIVLWQVLSHSSFPPMSLEQLQECFFDLDKKNIEDRQKILDGYLTLPSQAAIYGTHLRSITKLSPANRLNAAALYNNVRDISTSKAQQNWHTEKQHNSFLQTVVSDQLSEIGKQLQSLQRGQKLLGRQVGQVLRDNQRLDTMLRTLIAGTHAIPTYAIILPVLAATWIDKSNPMRLVRDEYILYFLCSHTHQIAPCGPKGLGEGYKITVTKQWVRDAAPVLMAALVVLKLALTAGGIPLPIPDLSPLLDSPALHIKFLDAALHLIKNPLDDIIDQPELVMDKALSVLDSVGENEVMDDIERASVSLEEGSKKAYAMIQSILATHDVDIALSSGLRQVTHPVSGKTAWVLDDDTVVQQYCDSAASVATTSPSGKAIVQQQVQQLQQRNAGEGAGKGITQGCRCIIC